MERLQRAVDWLRAGCVVAFPTDTFYGLAVDPQSSPAVQLLFEIKGRDSRSAVPLVAASIHQVEQCCGPLGIQARRMAERFWPGPLSLIVDAPASIASEVYGADPTVAIRVPAHPVARALCEAWGGPLTATSANRSGQAPARTAGELVGLGPDERLLVVDGGSTPGGLPSTIVDVRGASPVLVRAGALAWDRVLNFLKE
jgi:L-threonylcarbamoyladenylate synthase